MFGTAEFSGIKDISFLFNIILLLCRKNERSDGKLMLMFYPEPNYSLNFYVYDFYTVHDWNH